MNLKLFTNASNQAPALLKDEISPGDRIIVKTMNSDYVLTAGHGQQFRVSGGYFKKSPSGPVKTTVTGCSWGGSFMKFDAIAVCGLRMEFGNRIITSTIFSFAIFKAFQLN